MKNISDSLDTIKVYTILLVLLGHVLRMYTFNGAFPHQGTWLTDKLCSLIYSFHMPLFIFVSGCVYGICKKNNKYQTWNLLLANKIKRILYPYMSFGILVLAPCMVFTQLSDSYIEYCINEILWGGEVRHLWYLISLFEMFVFAHLIHKFLSNYRHYEVMAFILFFALLYRYVISYNFFQLRMTVSYFPYFIIGYYVGIGSIKISLSQAQAIILFIVGMIVWMVKYRLPDYTVHLTDYIVAIPLILVVFHISRLLSFRGFLYDIILKNAMGIYLWHVIILYIAYYYDCFASEGIYIQICLMLILSFSLSIALTHVIRKLHLFFLLGESK